MANDYQLNDANIDHLSPWEGFWHHSSRITVCIFIVVCLQIFYFTMYISFELALRGFWKSLVSDLHTRTVIQRPSNVVFCPPPLPWYTSVTYALLAWRFWNSIKRIYEWKWTQKFTNYRSSTHSGIKWRKWVEECIPLINPHIPGVVDSSDAPSCCSPPFLACFNNRCFTRHPCPLTCRWVWPVWGIGWDWRGRKIRFGHFFPISYFLHQPGVSLA